MAQNDDVVVAVISKNSREEIRVTRGSYMGLQTVRLWVWYRAKGRDEWRPGREGLAFRREQLHEIIDGLLKAGDGRVVPFKAQP
jgi:hypothetical protein